MKILILYRMLNRMKVTAIIPDNVVHEVKTLANGKSLTECMIIALREWIDLQHIRDLNKRIEKKPLRFQDGYSAQSIRELNRR